MRRIQGKKHKLGTYQINKTSLSCFDDKRYVQDNSINMLAYFHKNLRKKVLIKNRDSHRYLKYLKDAYKRKGSYG